MSLAVLYGCDDHYAPYTGISMTSLFSSNVNIKELTVYLAAMDISEENLSKFRRLASHYGREIILLKTKNAVKAIHECNCGTWNGSVAAWLRFFVLDQIPEEVEKLIWIDSDTIVEEELGSIAAIDIGDCPIAAVRDCIAIRERYRLGFSEREPYYNSGVIVFNMALFRDGTLLPSMLAYIRENASLFQIPDQDMMNSFFRGRIYKLPLRYNSQCFLRAYTVQDYYEVYPWELEAFYSEDEIREALDHPVITHFFRFLGDYPWTQGNNLHPAKGLYEEWKAISLWKAHKGAGARTELAFRVEKLLYQSLPRKMFLKVFAWYTNRKLPKKPY